MKKYILKLSFPLIIFVSLFVSNEIYDYLPNGLFPKLEAQNVLLDDRYLGSSWAAGYSWGNQPVRGSSALSVGGSASFQWDGSGGVTVSASYTETYDWINCCNPTNALSECNFGANNGNCIRY